MSRVRAQVGLGCFYCDARINVEFRALANQDRAAGALQSQGWHLAVNADGSGGVLMDPVCHACGLGLMRDLISRGDGRVDPDAAKSIRKMFPELVSELAE